MSNLISHPNQPESKFLRMLGAESAGDAVMCLVSYLFMGLWLAFFLIVVGGFVALLLTPV